MRYRWFAKKPPGESQMPKGRAGQEPPSGQGFSYGDKASLLLAAVLLVWALWNGDLPVAFFCLAFIIYALRPLAEALGPGLGTSLSNVMQGFSLALAAGTLVWVFL